MAHVKEELQKLIVERDDMVYSGKNVEEISDTKGESSLSLEVQLSVLWFAELIPEFSSNDCIPSLS